MSGLCMPKTYVQILRMRSLRLCCRPWTRRARDVTKIGSRAAPTLARAARAVVRQLSGSMIRHILWIGFRFVFRSLFFASAPRAVSRRAQGRISSSWGCAFMLVLHVPLRTAVIASDGGPVTARRGASRRTRTGADGRRPTPPRTRAGRVTSQAYCNEKDEERNSDL